MEAEFDRLDTEEKGELNVKKLAQADLGASRLSASKATSPTGATASTL